MNDPGLRYRRFDLGHAVDEALHPRLVPACRAMSAIDRLLVPWAPTSLDSTLGIMRQILETPSVDLGYDRGHVCRVGIVSGMLIDRMGFDPKFANTVRVAAMFHDIGKLYVRQEVVDKPGALTSSERAEMNTHTVRGSGLLSQGTSPVLLVATEIAMNHHEHWCGGGYPRGLSGSDIPLSARLVAVADVHDARTHPRSYNTPLGREAVLSEIQDDRRQQFDPAIVAGFVELMDTPETIDRRDRELEFVLGHNASFVD